MMNYFFNIFCLCLLFILMSYVLNRNHVLMMLISLEFISMMIFVCLYMSVSMLISEQYFLMIFLCFCVCEGVLGLSLLVGMIRSHGSDFLDCMSFLKC